MTTPPDSLARALDDAIGAGPSLPPVTDHLAPGRRAVRRRRTAAAVGAAAVVAVLGGTVIGATAGGNASKPDSQDVAAPSTPPNPTTAPASLPLGYGESGVRSLDRGVRLVDQITNPVPPPPSGRTDAFALRIDGTVGYYLMQWRPADVTTVLARGERGDTFPTLASWVRAQPDQRLDDPDAEDVYRLSSETVDPGFSLSDSGELSAPRNVTVLRVVDNPLDLPAPRFSAGIVYRFEGKVRWGVVSDLVFPGSPVGIAGTLSVVPGPEYDSLEDWIASLPRTPSGDVG